MAIFSNLSNYKNFGLLILRVGLGIMFIWHGYPKLLGGPEGWEKLGQSMQFVGINFAPVFWGLMSGITETLGGLLILIGFFYRPVCLLLVVNLGVAAAMHFGRGEGLMGAAHPIELAIVFFGLAFIGPGKYSVDKR